MNVDLGNRMTLPARALCPGATDRLHPVWETIPPERQPASEAFIAGPGCNGRGFKCASLFPDRRRIIEKSRDLPIEGSSSFEVQGETQEAVHSLALGLCAFGSLDVGEYFLVQGKRFGAFDGCSHSYKQSY